MDPEQLEIERTRFNALSPEDAKEILKNVEVKSPAFRSCWYCNGAHEHLKYCKLLRCFVCGIYHLSGYPAFVVVKISKGEEVSVADMATFNEILQCLDDYDGGEQEEE